MFCALNGATLMPRPASQRHSPAVRTLFPASDVVPATSSAPFTAAGPSWCPRPRCLHPGCPRPRP